LHVVRVNSDGFVVYKVTIELSNYALKVINDFMWGKEGGRWKGDEREEGGN
jgi:hypothetical protein